MDDQQSFLGWLGTDDDDDAGGRSTRTSYRYDAVGNVIDPISMSLPTDSTRTTASTPSAAATSMQLSRWVGRIPRYF